MFEELEKINERPEPFQFYTAKDLWTDEHTSQQMLSFHLNEAIDVSSRNMEFIDNSVQWITSELKINKGFKIVDFGCGPGLYAARLAKQGASVIGIDFSGRSIEYAKDVAAREKLNIRYVHQNYLKFEAEDRFDLILPRKSGHRVKPQEGIFHTPAGLRNQSTNDVFYDYKRFQCNKICFESLLIC